MILPGKHLRHDRALLSLGADILTELDQPRTVSELWEHVKISRDLRSTSISFDWFVLSLSFLFAISAIESKNGIVYLGSSR